MQLRLLDGNILRAKFEVIEKPNGLFISTLWIPDHGPEADRCVNEFETYSEALVDMYRDALEVSIEFSNLHIEECWE